MHLTIHAVTLEQVKITNEYRNWLEGAVLISDRWQFLIASGNESSIQVPLGILRAMADGHGLNVIPLNRLGFTLPLAHLTSADSQLSVEISVLVLPLSSLRGFVGDLLGSLIVTLRSNHFLGGLALDAIIARQLHGLSMVVHTLTKVGFDTFVKMLF